MLKSYQPIENEIDPIIIDKILLIIKTGIYRFRFSFSFKIYFTDTVLDTSPNKQGKINIIHSNKNTIKNISDTLNNIK